MKKSLANKLSLNPAKFSKLRPLIFVAVFAAIGGAYLLGTHAASTLTLRFTSQDTAGHPLNGVFMAMSNGCSPANGTTTQTNSQNPTPTAYFYCSNGYAYLTSISLAGYHLCGCSAVQVGTQYGANYPANGGGGVITMQANTPPPSPPPAPTPTPTPTPAPTPTPPKSTPSSGSKTGSSSSHTTTSPTLTTTSGSTTGDVSPPATDVQPASNGDGTDQFSSDSSASPNVPSGSSSTVTSGDNIVSVTFPKGTFGTDAYCSINIGDTKDVPVKSAGTLGPYSIDCTDSNGSPLNSLKKSVVVQITPPANGSKYIAYADSPNWVKIPTSSNGKTISFKLAKSEQFAMAPAKASSWGIILLNVIGGLVLLLVIGGFLLYRHHRSQYANYDTPTS